MLPGASLIQIAQFCFNGHARGGLFTVAESGLPPAAASIHIDQRWANWITLGLLELEQFCRRENFSRCCEWSASVLWHGNLVERHLSLAPLEEVSSSSAAWHRNKPLCRNQHGERSSYMAHHLPLGLIGLKLHPPRSN